MKKMLAMQVLKSCVIIYLARNDVIIAIGGDTWDELPARAGVAAEMAIENNLPCFVLGGFGGSAEE